jgi:hypothetical protein
MYSILHLQIQVVLYVHKAPLKDYKCIHIVNEIQADPVDYDLPKSLSLHVFSLMINRH